MKYVLFFLLIPAMSWGQEANSQKELDSIYKTIYPVDTNVVFRQVCDTLPERNAPVRGRHLLEVRERHNTSEGQVDPGFCPSCWHDYWKHIKYLTLEKKRIPKTWVVIETIKEHDRETVKAPKYSPPDKAYEGLIDSASILGIASGNLSFSMDSGSLKNYILVGNYYTDTILVVRDVTNETPSSWWRHVSHRPVRCILYAIHQLGKLERYLDRRKRPLPGYLKVWPNQ